MYEYLCSCLPWGQEIVRTGVNKVVEYLNSNNMNQQILEEEKCVDDYEHEQGEDHHPSVYQINKNKAYKAIDHQEDDHNKDQQQPPQIQPDVDSLPREQKYAAMAKLAMGNLRRHLMMRPQEEDFQKLLDSQDEKHLVVYYRLKLTSESKRLNLFRFSYTLNMTLKQYRAMFTDEALHSIQQNLSHFEEVERIAEDLTLCYCQYKKVLVVMPRDFLFLKFTEDSESMHTTVAVSVGDDTAKPLVKDLVRGKVVLSGTAVQEVDGQVIIQSYLEIDMDLQINPLMIKQPAIREIKKYVEKIHELSKTAIQETNPQHITQEKEAINQYPQDSALMESIEGI